MFVCVCVCVKFFELRNNKALLEYIPDDYIVSLWKQCGRREFTLIANIPSTYRNFGCAATNRPDIGASMTAYTCDHNTAELLHNKSIIMGGGEEVSFCYVETSQFRTEVWK